MNAVHLIIIITKRRDENKHFFFVFFYQPILVIKLIVHSSRLKIVNQNGIVNQNKQYIDDAVCAPA